MIATITRQQYDAAPRHFRRNTITLTLCACRAECFILPLLENHLFRLSSDPATAIALYFNQGAPRK